MHLPNYCRQIVTQQLQKSFRCFLFFFFIQLCDSKKMHYLTCEFRFAIRAISVFKCMQFNAEFTSQMMNFLILYVYQVNVRGLEINNFDRGFLLPRFVVDICGCHGDWNVIVLFASWKNLLIFCLMFAPLPLTIRIVTWHCW